MKLRSVVRRPHWMSAAVWRPLARLRQFYEDRLPPDLAAAPTPGLAIRINHVLLTTSVVDQANEALQPADGEAPKFDLNALQYLREALEMQRDAVLELERYLGDDAIDLGELDVAALLNAAGAQPASNASPQPQPQAAKPAPATAAAPSTASPKSTPTTKPAPKNWPLPQSAPATRAERDRPWTPPRNEKPPQRFVTFP